MPARCPSPQSRRLLRVKLPQHVDDHPAAVPLGEVQIIDPARGVDLGAGSILIDVEDGDVLFALGGWRVFTAASARAHYERHRALLAELTSALVIGADDALRELGVDCALHPCAVARVPPVDVIE